MAGHQLLNGKLPKPETPETFKYQCPKRCQDPQHAEKILLAIHSMTAFPGDVRHRQLIAAYIAKSCRNFARIHDADFRSTALHVIAKMPCSANLLGVAEFLLNQGADVNAVDWPLKHTPMHYACMRSNVALATLLRRRGADLNALSNHNMMPFSFWSEYGKPTTDGRKKEAVPMEVLAWGNMNNDNCGFVRNATGRNMDEPLPLERLNRGDFDVQHVALSPLHCLFTDAEGRRLWAVGNGSSGLLGSETMQCTVLDPIEVNLSGLGKNNTVIAISVSRNTSMLLTQTHNVFTCGLNTYHQLGYDTAKQDTFRRVRFNFKRGFTPDRIVALDKYSLAFDRDRMVMWGTCAGQFGSRVRSLKRNEMAQIDFVTPVQRVSANDWAIAVQIADESIQLMHNYGNQTVALPKFCDVQEFCLETGRDKKDPVRLAILSAAHEIFVWISNVGLLTISPTSHHNTCDQLLFANEILTFILNAQVYRSELHVVRGSSLPDARRASTTTGASDDDESDFIFPGKYQPFVSDFVCRLRYDSRVPFLDRVHRVSGASDGRSFVALQTHSKRTVGRKQQTSDEVRLQLHGLLAEAHADDGIVDVVFRVGGRSFAAHKFVVLSQASGLERFMLAQTIDEANKVDHNSPQQLDEVCLDEVPGLTAPLFALVLRYLYDDGGERIGASEYAINHLAMTDERMSDANESIKIFGRILKEFGISSASAPSPFRRLEHQQLGDVTLRCGEQRVNVRAHKCILVARSEYFRMMFSHNWSESDTVNLPHIAAEYMVLLLDYLYSDDMATLTGGGQPYSDANLYELIMVCDQMLLLRALDCFEELLLNRLTLKKCLEMMQFALDLHLPHMEKHCEQFMYSNACRLLDRRLLDGASEEILMKVTEFGEKQAEPCYQRRYEVQHVLAVGLLTVSQVEEFVDNFTVDLTAIVDVEPAETPRKSEKTTGRSTALKLQTANQFSGDDLSAARAKSHTPETPKIVRQAKRIADELSADFARWFKVSSVKQSQQAAALSKASRTPPAANANAVLAQEPKPDNVFVRLRRTTNTDGEHIDDDGQPIDEQADDKDNDDGTPERRRRTVSLGMFTPTVKSKRRSQRAAREEAAAAAAAAEIEAATVSPDTSPVVENAWALRMSSPATAAAANVTTTPKKEEPAGSFFAAIKSDHVNTGLATPKEKKSANKTNGIALKSIQKEEQRDKDNFNRMLNKPLWMTQTEETALIELRKFYNVENVFDERINVERVAANPTTRSHAVWYQHETRDRKSTE